MASVTLRIRSYSVIWPGSATIDSISRFVDYLLGWSKSENWLRDETDLRYSLVGGARLSDTAFYGVLTQEHLLERHVYSDDKLPSRNALDSYEDRFFLFDLAEQRVTLDWRRFIKKVPLTLPRTIKRLEFTFNYLWQRAGYDGTIALAAVFHETSKTEFIDLFYEHRALVLEVSDIGIDEVPMDVQLVNPNRHLEGTLRQLLRHDHDHDSLDRVQAEVYDDGEGDLRRSAIARGIVHSGIPKRLRFQSPTGYIRVRSQTENGIQSISIPTTDLDTAEDRAYIAAIVAGAARGIDIPLPPRPQELEQPAPANLDLFHD